MTTRTLVALANKLDDAGHSDLANEIDGLIQQGSFLDPIKRLYHFLRGDAKDFAHFTANWKTEEIPGLGEVCTTYYMGKWIASCTADEGAAVKILFGATREEAIAALKKAKGVE